METAQHVKDYVAEHGSKRPVEINAMSSTLVLWPIIMVLESLRPEYGNDFAGLYAQAHPAQMQAYHILAVISRDHNEPDIKVLEDEYISLVFSELKIAKIPLRSIYTLPKDELRFVNGDTSKIVGRIYNLTIPAGWA